MRGGMLADGRYPDPPPQARQTRVSARRAQSSGGVTPASASEYQKPVRKVPGSDGVGVSVGRTLIDRPLQAAADPGGARHDEVVVLGAQRVVDTVSEHQTGERQRYGFGDAAPEVLELGDEVVEELTAERGGATSASRAMASTTSDSLSGQRRKIAGREVPASAATDASNRPS